MVIDAGSRYFVELLSRPVCQLTISFYTFLDMTLHIIGPRRNTDMLREWLFLYSHRGNSRFKHGSVIVHNIFVYFDIVFECTPGIQDQGKMLVLPNRLLYSVLSTSDH